MAEVLNLDDIIYSRAIIYETLGKLFLYRLDQDYFDQVQNNNIFDVFSSQEDSQASSYLSEFFKGNLTKEIEDKLNKDFDELFLGPYRLKAVPWRSVYVGEEKIIFDENTLEVKEFLKEDNIIFDFKEKLPEDHIGVLFAYLSILNQRASGYLKEEDLESLSENLARQKTFIDSYIKDWSDEFFENLLENSSTSFYKNLGEFSKEYLEVDEDILDNIREELKIYMEG